MRLCAVETDHPHERNTHQAPAPAGAHLCASDNRQSLRLFHPEHFLWQFRRQIGTTPGKFQNNKIARFNKAGMNSYGQF